MLASKTLLSKSYFFIGQDVYGGGDEPCVTLLVIMCFCVPNL